MWIVFFSNGNIALACSLIAWINIDKINASSFTKQISYAWKGKYNFSWDILISNPMNVIISPIVFRHRNVNLRKMCTRLQPKHYNYNENMTKRWRYLIRTVSFIWIWFILILNNLCLKSPLKVNLSPSSTSFPLGFLFRTLALPQARDCRVLFNSLSSVK